MPALSADSPGMCRGASEVRKLLAALFEVAPECLPAKIMEARLMLQEKDHGGEPQPGQAGP